MARIASITRGMLTVVAIIASVVFGVALPAMASTAPPAAGSDVIACPLAAAPPATGPVMSPIPVPTCSPPCPPLPTPQPSGAIACPVSATSIIPLCTVSTFRNLGTTFCLDTDSSARRSVFSVACTGSRSQQWVFTRSNTTSTIRDLASGLCLSSNATGDVFAVSCTSPPTTTPVHQWFITQSGGPLIDVVTGRCLASPLVPGPSLIPVNTSQCNGTPAQNWAHN
jgi:hypothetical protein